MYRTNEFKPINKPDMIQKGLKGRNIAVGIHIKEEQLTDVVDLQYTLLIKRYFKNIKVLFLLDGSSALRFKASHYLYSIYSEDSDFYESFWCPETNGPVRLPRENIEHITDFFPVQYLEKENNIFAESLGTKLNSEQIFDLLSGKNQGKEIPLILKGCLKKLKKRKNLLNKLNPDDFQKFMNTIYGDDILSFVLFSYSIEYCPGILKKDMDAYDIIMNHYRAIQECAECCEQLIENIFFHSPARAGALSIRYHERKSEYLSKQYGSYLDEIPYLEILITDYAGMVKADNIAENFKNNIKDADMKALFDGLCPVDLINRNRNDNQKIEKAFKEYYSYADNLGRHYGLQIFRQIIEKNKAVFTFYSHAGHMRKHGEEYQIVPQGTGTICIPGTGYGILFPMRHKEKTIVSSQIGIEQNNQIRQERQEREFHCQDHSIISKYSSDFATQQSKDLYIKELAGNLELSAEDADGKRNIYYIDSVGMPGEMGEYLCKALLIAGNRSRISDYVFYNCSDEFLLQFKDTMGVYLGIREMAFCYANHEFVIALYKNDPVEGVFLIPGHLKKTVFANRLNGYAGAEGEDLHWLLKYSNLYPDEHFINDIPPYDVLHGIPIGNNPDLTTTIFEKYILQVLRNNIQNEAIGCRLEDTHMRLGSTIHISRFYEAEILFSNQMFVSRFAYLLFQDIVESADFQNAEKITVYSYALYSELLVVKLITMLQKKYSKKSFDYAILEREAEHREFLHSDRMRYSLDFQNVQERKKHFEDRKIICIVPVNSTLKTHEKLISLLKEDNGEKVAKNVILNYALILVGSEKENKYWTIDSRKKTFSRVELNIQPMPKYFVLVKVDYQEALGCKMCFPENPLNEKPLIEVNASSTIPNQAFGLQKKSGCEEKISYQRIMQEEENVCVLKNSLIYSHLQRGQNHFLYYFKTDILFLEHKEKIREWLQTIADEIKFDANEYSVVFSPAHFSNAGFLELINEVVFQGAALIIRADIDKEYRCNICVKYSNLTNLIQMLGNDTSQKYKIKIYYVDDSIITGRTFYRAKSLALSLTGQYSSNYDNIEICVFEKIFVLLDRNSEQSRLQYINGKPGEVKTAEQLQDHYFAFRTLRISSMRSHGNSCVLCQLEQEAQYLYQISSTRRLAAYWKRSQKKFEKNLLNDKQHELGIKGDSGRDKAFRRMFCTHMAGIVLSERYHNNQKENAFKLMLDLLLEDYTCRKKESGQEEAFEYFLSYLKIMSRPFIVFNKAIKEAIFDLLLMLTEMLLSQNRTENFVNCMEKEKTYLLPCREKLKKLRKKIIEDMSLMQKKDFLLLLMKQLTELKSNYFIRIENIKKMTSFLKKYEKEGYNDVCSEFYERFLIQTKKTTGINSDTSKSAWLEHALYEYRIHNEEEKELNLPPDVYGRLILENTRAYTDGINKLCASVSLNEETRKFLNNEKWIEWEYQVFSEFQPQIDKGTVSANEIKIFIERNRSYLTKAEREWLKTKDPAGVFLKIYKDIKKEHNKMQNHLWISCLKSTLEKELARIQYRDFCHIIRDYGWYSENGLTRDGVISIAAGMEMMQLGTEEERDREKKENENLIEDECRQIVNLLVKILHAQKVLLVMERPSECNQWEERLWETYNTYVEKRLGANGSQVKRSITEQREYLILADSTNCVNVAESAQIDVTERLRIYKKARDTNGYYINEKYMVWEIGAQNESHTLIAYVEFYNLKLPDDWWMIRNAMVMNYSFSHTVFNRRAINYLYEIVMAEKDRLMYNQDKSHSHTDMTVRQRQFTDAVSGEELLKDHFRSYILTLLSDLQVSSEYRQSLKNSYYHSILRICTESWKDIYQFLKEKKQILSVESGQTWGKQDKQYLLVHIITDQKIFEDEVLINPDDRMLVWDEAFRKENLFLLLYALIMNAAGRNRGKREEGPYGLQRIDVYLTRTEEGDLRISNKCVEAGTETDQINSQLEYPPGRDQGISVWSISRYIRKMVSVMAQDMIQKTVKETAEMDDKKAYDKCMKLRDALEDLLERRCRVKASVKKYGAEEYFCMEVPIFYKKYEEFLEG